MYYEFPLGLAYISACLKQNDFQVRVLNLNHYGEDLARLIDRETRRKQYDFVLTGGLSAHHSQVKNVVDSIRASSPGSVVIAGGGLMSATPELMYDHIRPDYMVLGEGEVTIVELIRELSLGNKHPEDVMGIGYRDGSGEVVMTKPRVPIMDLDALPWPDLEGFEFETYLAMQQPNDSLYLYVDDSPRFYPIISSRGCVFNCTFCYHPLGQAYRSRSVENFIMEIESAIDKYDIKNLAVFDELISANKKRLLAICDRLKKLPRKLHWMCQLRVDSVDEEMLVHMKDAGCFIISYGFESANNSVLESMKKRITKAQIERALSLTRKAGIGIQAYFIFGDSAETKETAYETLDFSKKHRDYHITMGYVRPYPGSELWKRDVSKGHLDTAREQLDLIDRCVNNPPNLSAMSDEDWFELQKDVQKEIILNDHVGKVISSKQEAPDRYSITVLCPHCRQQITYRNFQQRILGVFKLACRNCNQAMNMTPLVFDHVREDYSRNRMAYEKIITSGVPVTVTPCMNEAEFSAMAEIALQKANIVNFLDRDDKKTKTLYLGKKVLKRSAENINTACRGHFFVIPLTRFADRIFDHLVEIGVAKERICRLDEVIVGREDERA
jgi:radical SAM superfamily enzyme YgiQ (UPF0313 family)